MRVFSGIQPSGKLHLGNYAGAVKSWLEYQKNNIDAIYSIVDLHAITVWQDPQLLRDATYNLYADLLALGLKEEKSTIFVQSHVSQHLQLAWILSSVARIGWLNRMVNFKDKSGKNREKASVGLYIYPILQAADILLYKADEVPVGEDQRQHIELARDIATKFNKDYGVDFFKVPEIKLQQNAYKIMSLKNVENKMSKSDSSQNGVIYFSDTNDMLAKKIAKSTTDSLPFPEDDSQLNDRLAVKNLMNIYSLVTECNYSEIMIKYGGMSFKQFKDDLTELLIKFISPVRELSSEICKDHEFIDNKLSVAKEKVSDIACETLDEVTNIVGFIKE